MSDYEWSFSIKKKKKKTLRTSEKDGEVEVIEPPLELKKEKEEDMSELNAKDDNESELNAKGEEMTELNAKDDNGVELKNVKEDVQLLSKLQEVPDPVEVKNSWDVPPNRKVGVREIKGIICFCLFLFTMMGIVLFSAPPLTKNKQIAIGVVAFTGLITCMVVAISSPIGTFIQRYVLPALGTEEDARKKFLMSIIEMDESRDVYVGRTGIRVDSKRFEIDNPSSYIVGDDLVVVFSFREIFCNRSCTLTLDSISYREYNATDEEGRIDMICEKLAAAAKSFNLFQ